MSFLLWPALACQVLAQTADDTASTYASMYGVSLDEAHRRLEVQGLVGGLNARLESEAASTFAGMVVQHTPTYRVVARFTTDPAATLRRFIRGTPLEGVVEAELAVLPYTTLVDLIPQAMAVARTVGIDANAAADVAANEVVLFVLDAGPLETAIRAGVVRLPARVRIEVVDHLTEGGISRTPLEDSAPPLLGTWWRLASLGGESTTGDALPVLIFTDRPCDRDRFDRSLGDACAGWRLLIGWTGAGAYHAPYRAQGDSLRIEAPFELERIVSDDPAVQDPLTDRARALADALARTQRHALDGRTLAFLDAQGDTLATFAADVPRTPAPFAGAEWVLDTVGGAPVVPGTRPRILFSSDPIGPGITGYDAEPSDPYDQVGGHSGCNEFGTGYRVTSRDDGLYELAFSGPPLSTLIGCRPAVAEQERAVQGVFYGRARIQHEGDRLALLDSTGAEYMVFHRHVPYATDRTALMTGRWRFDSAPMPPGMEQNVPDGPMPVLAFEDSAVTARIGCRTDRGTYTLDGDDYRAEWTESNDSACSESQRLEPFWNPLYRGKLAVSDDRLSVYDEDGLEIVFRR